MRRALRFLFKPSISYALVANTGAVAVVTSLWHLLAGITYLVLSSILGATIETIMMKTEEER
jgi:hypothetical protein